MKQRTDRPTSGAHHRQSRRRWLAVAVALAALAALVPAQSSVAGAQAAPTVGMRLLVIAADGNETDYPAIRSFLDQVGVPYDAILATEVPLTEELLQVSPTEGRYQGIVLTTGNLTYFDAEAGTWQSAFTPEEWTRLRSYQAAFGVRSVTSFTFPEAAYGLSYVGYQDTLTAELPAQLTPAGQLVFPYINQNNAVPLRGAWAYFGEIVDPSVTTPLITTTVGGQTYPIASVTRYPEGYENLAITVANNPNLTHSLLFSGGWIRWVTKGMYLGARYANLDIQIDDLFLTSDMWNPATLSSSGSYRNTATDITALARYQNARRADPMTRNFKVEFAFNGTGARLFTDGLTNSVVANRSQFGFINHTYTHYNLDCADCPEPTGVITSNPTTIRNEILQNVWLGALLGLPMDRDTMVQPDISGINTPPNPMAQKAAADAGIRWWIGDTSRPGQGNPTFNTGFTTAGDSRIYVVPRHPNNLFYSVSTPDQWVSMYNHFYAPGGILCEVTTCFDAPQTYSQILDREADYMVRYWLRGDLNPLMFHTPNVRAYNGSRSVLTDLVDTALAKYKALVKTPIRTLSFKQAGLLMQARGAYDAAGVTASVTPCTSITLRATKAATVPLSGVSYQASNSTVENYGGQVISHVRLAAGQTVTIPLPAC
jgi:hypothetical protein